MLKIISIALISLILFVVLKQKSPELAMVVSVAGGMLILFFCFEYLSEIVSYYINLSSSIGIESSIIKIALKIVCVGFLTEFVSDLAVDFGNMAISSKIVFGGKVVICVIILPVVKELVSLLFFFS